MGFNTVANKMKRVEEEISEKQLSKESLLRDIDIANASINEFTKSTAPMKAKVAKVEMQLRKLSSRIAAFHLALHNCMENIQNPIKLRSIVSDLYGACSSSSHAATDPHNSNGEQTKNDETGLKVLEMKKYLDDLKAEDLAMSKSHKEERAHQIQENFTFLQQVSSKNAARKVFDRSTEVVAI